MQCPSLQRLLTLLVDATNAFNELNRKAMLWTVAHLWPSGARFSFNCYRHSTVMVVRRRGGTPEYILSREGVTQGDPLSMLLYGLAMTPLALILQREEPGVVWAWYADDAALSGPPAAVANGMRLLLRYGPARGYFPCPAKSILIDAPPEDSPGGRLLAEFSFEAPAGSRYLGGFLGKGAARESWVGEKVAAWTESVRDLARVAVRHPQAALAGLTRSLQQE